MTAAQDLAANPLDFMKKNIVIVEMEGNNTVRRTQGVMNLRLYSRPKTRIKGHKRNMRKSSVNVYYLSPDPVPAFFTDAVIDPNTITAYFCPYKQDETHGTTISNGANLMFTTQMDGCSLGIGSANAAGDRLIFHANSHGTPAVATANQHQSLTQEFAADNANIEQMWEPGSYRESKKGTFYKATTFGVRDGNNQWSFYSQRYTVETMVPVITLGMKEVATVL